MNHLGIEVPVQHVPELDPGFLPLGKFNAAFRTDAKKPLALAVERSQGQVAVYRTFIHGTPERAQADCYYALVARLAEVPQVDIVGHFDLITKFDEPHTRYPIVPPSARAAMERLVRAGKIFEINTGAISRGYRQTPYPAEPLLRLLREMDGKILFTADAHRACDVAFGYAEAVELACRCGFDTFWRLTEEGFVPAPLHRALT